MTKISSLGYPRLGENREWKKLIEAYWAGAKTFSEAVKGMVKVGGASSDYAVRSYDDYWKEWKKSRRLWGLLKLGLPKWLADKVSGWGDHYQLVAQKSVLKHAISKPVLTKRGLVFCLDYYLDRHALKGS